MKDKRIWVNWFKYKIDNSNKRGIEATFGFSPLDDNFLLRQNSINWITDDMELYRSIVKLLESKDNDNILIAIEIMKSQNNLI